MRRALLLTALVLSPLPAVAGKKERPPADIMRIHVLEVGQGDATIIEGPRDENGDRKIMVVDAPETKKAGNESQHTIEPYLRNNLDDGPPGRPVIDIDYLVPTHYHSDHIGKSTGDVGSGIFYLWEALNIRVRKLLDTGLDYDASGNGDVNYRRWVKDNRVERETLRFDQLGEGRQIDLGEGVWVEPLAIAAEVEGRGRAMDDEWVRSSSQNDFSIALVVHFKKFDFFVAGDLSGYLHESWGSWYHPVESAMYPHLRPLEVYRVNHHGSQWSTNYAFLQRIRPIASVLSCGVGHKHPNEYALKRVLGYEDYWTGRPMGSDVFQTLHADGYLMDAPHPHTEKVQYIANGDILIETDGETGFSITMPGREPITYPMQPDPAFLTPPDSVLEARQAKLDGTLDQWRRKWGRMFDRTDAEKGLLISPKVDDMGGAD